MSDWLSLMRIHQIKSVKYYFNDLNGNAELELSKDNTKATLYAETLDGEKLIWESRIGSMSRSALIKELVGMIR